VLSVRVSAVTIVLLCGAGDQMGDEPVEIKKDGDVYSGDLTEDGAKALLTAGFRRNNANPPTNAKGSVKFWVKDGAITKYETKGTGKGQFNGESMDIERTTTVEIKDVGKTKVEVPDDARKKLS